MGYMKEERILDFVRDLKKNLIKYEDNYGGEFGIYSYEYYVRYGSKIANLQTMIYFCEDPADAFDPADCSLEEFYDDPYIDVYISCEGSMYEAVYGYDAYGGDEKSKALHDAFNDAAEKYGMTMGFCDGALSFQSKESWDKQDEDEKIEWERMEDEFRRWKVTFSRQS